MPPRQPPTAYDEPYYDEPYYDEPYGAQRRIILRWKVSQPARSTRSLGADWHRPRFGATRFNSDMRMHEYVAD